MKRMLFSGLAAVLIAVAGFSYAVAQEADGPQPRRGGFGVGGWRGGGPGGIARFADLTEEQRAQVRAILQEERTSRQGAPGSVTTHRELQAEILADVPDEQKIDTLRRQLAEEHAASLQRGIALQRKIAQVLTPEQRTKARERLAQAPQPRQRGNTGVQGGR
ncbi:MAG TPA: periplasmic heavy metal sensor [Vicinamibacterales bacterium]|nr:periplasmic heavy metal sensor [Vicinamibacterales bacterium]